MFKKYYEFASQINKNSKTSKKIKLSIITQIIVLCLVIFFCATIPYIVDQAYYKDDKTNTIKVEASDGDSVGYRTEDVQAMVGSKAVKSAVKYSDIEMHYAQVSIGGEFSPFIGALTKPLRMRGLYDNYTVRHNSPIVEGRDIVNKGEIVVSRQFAQDCGFDDDLIGKNLSVKVEAPSLSFFSACVDDDTIPDNEPINSLNNVVGNGYNDYLDKPLDMYILKNFKIVGVVGEAQPKGLSFIEAAKLKIPKEEVEIWFNTENLNLNAYDVPQANKHDIMVDKSFTSKNCVILTYNYFDINARSIQVADEGLIYVSSNPYAYYKSGVDYIYTSNKNYSDTKPVYKYLISYKDYNSAVKKADETIEMLARDIEKYCNIKISPTDSMFNSLQSAVQTTEMENLRQVKIYTDPLFIFIAIFGLLLTIVLIISECNAVRFYVANKKDYYSMLHKIGADKASLAAIKKIELLDIILKAIVFAFIACAIVAIIVISCFATELVKWIAVSEAMLIAVAFIFLAAFASSAILGGVVAFCVGIVEKKKK